MVQLVGGVTAAQLKPILLEEDAVAVSPVGAEGTAVHDGAAEVVAVACVEEAEVPSASTALTV
jgi:hypothetical protein